MRLADDFLTNFKIFVLRIDDMTILMYGIDAGTFKGMRVNRKITLELPEDLLRKAQRCTGEGLTATVRRGLELLAASTAYTELHKLRGKVKFSIELKQLRNDG